jgi:Bacterial dnaA protein helix-turn-helix
VAAVAAKLLRDMRRAMEKTGRLAWPLRELSITQLRRINRCALPLSGLCKRANTMIKFELPHVPDYETEGEMLAVYAAVRARLMQPPLRPRVQSAAPTLPPPPVIDLPDQFATMAGSYTTKPSIDQILRAVCRSFNCTRFELLSRHLPRTKFIVYRRGIAIALCRHLARSSYPEIGRRLDSLDHTSVLHMVRKMQPHLDAAAAGMLENASVGEWVSAMRAQLRI